MTSYLSDLVQSRKGQLAKQVDSYSQDVELADALVSKIKTLGISSQHQTEAYKKEKSRLERAQQACSIEAKSMGLKAKSKLQHLNLLRAQNEELVRQLNMQAEVVKEQRRHLEFQYSKEELIELERKEERETYSHKLQQMMSKYEKEQTKLKIDMLQTALSEMEDPSNSRLNPITPAPQSAFTSKPEIKDLKLDEAKPLSSKEIFLNSHLGHSRADVIEGEPPRIIKVDFSKKDAKIETDDLDPFQDSRTLQVRGRNLSKCGRMKRSL